MCGSLGTRWWILIQLSRDVLCGGRRWDRKLQFKGFNWKGTQLRLSTRARGLSRCDGWSLALAMSLSRREGF